MSELFRSGKLEATQQTPKFFETLLHASTDGIVVTGATQNIVVVNESFCALFDRRWQDVVETNLFVWLEQLDADAPQRWAELEQCVRLEGVCRDAEFQMTTEDGVRRFSVNASPLEQATHEETGAIISLWRDVTERVRAEERLRFLSSAVEQSSEGTAISDLEGNLLFVNDAFAAMHGYALEELAGKHLSIFHTPEQLPAVEAINQRIQETGEFSGEIWHARRDGTVFPTLMHNTLLRDKAGNPIGMIGALRDITARVQVDEEIRRRTVQLEALREIYLELTAQLDLDALLHSIVSSAIELLGGGGGGFYLYRPDRDVLEWIVSIGLSVAPVGTILHRGEGLSGKVLETGERIVVDDYWRWEGQSDAWESYPFAAIVGVPTRWGKDFLGVLTVNADTPRAFSPADAELLSLFAAQAAIAIRNARLYEQAQREISERKRAEDALRESEEKWRSLVQNIPDIVMKIARDGTIVAINRAVGMTITEAIGSNIYDYVLPEHGVLQREALEQVFQTGKPASHEILGFGPEGPNTAWYETRIVPDTLDDQCNTVTMISTDVTERKRVEERLERLNRLKENLLSPHSLDEKLKRITDGVVEIFDADFCRIWIVKPGDLCDSSCLCALVTKGPHVCQRRDRCLHLTASSGRYTHTDGEMHRRVPFGAHKIGRVASGEDAKFITNDVTRDPRVHDRDWARQLGLVSFAGYRLLSQAGEPIGVLALFSKQVLAPDVDALLEDLASTTAQVIQTAKVEEALRESEERYRTLFENVPVGLYRTTPEGQLLDANYALVEMTGYSDRESLLVDDAANLYADPRGRARWKILVEHKETTHASETQWRRHDGTVIWVRDSAQAIRDAEGRVLYYEGAAEDITERRRAEEALNRRVEQLAALSQASQAMTASLELNQVLAEIVSLTNEMAASDYTSVVLVDEAGRVGQSTENLPGVPVIKYRMRDKGLTSWITHSRQAVVIDAIGEDGAISPALGEGAPRFANPFIVETNVKSVAGLPLIAKDNLLGVLYLYSLRTGAFRDQLPLLDTFANQAASAVENARLHETVQQELAERKRAEEALVQSVSLLQATLESTADGILVVDRMGRIINFNQRFTKMWRIPDDVLASKDDDQVLAFVLDQLSDPDKFITKVRTLYDQPEAESFDVLYFKDGRIFERYSQPQRVEEQAVGRMWSFRDVTERKQAEEEICQRNRELALLNQASQALNSTLDLDQVLVTVLGEMHHLLDVVACSAWLIDLETGEVVCRGTTGPQSEIVRGWRLALGEGLVGRVAQSGERLIVPDTQTDARHFKGVDQQTGMALRSILSVPLRVKQDVIGVLQAADETINRFSSTDLTLVESLAATAAIAIENARLFATEQQRAASLARTLEQQQELDRLKSEFIRNVSHELRTPLALALGYAELLDNGDLGELQTDQQEPVLIIARRMRMLSKLVDNINAILEAETQKVQREPVDLADLAHTILADFQVAAEQHELTLTAEVASGLSSVLGDPLHLRRALDNLMSNALKFTPAGGCITMHLRPAGTNVILEVADTGIGIPADQLERIFERFYQVDGSVTRRYGGAGLGLALVREIVEAHGGTVSVRSTVGEGSAFQVTLPSG